MGDPDAANLAALARARCEARHAKPVDPDAIPFTMESANANRAAEKKMAEDLNRQRVLNFLETFYSRDTEGALAWCSDDISFLASAPVGILPHMGSHHGKAEVMKMWQTIHTRYSDMRYEVPIVVAAGNKVATLIRVFFRKQQNDRIVQFDL